MTWYNNLKFTRCEYHRNGCAGAGYYAVEMQWHVGREKAQALAVVFDADEHIAIMAASDSGVSYRYEDFAPAIRQFVESKTGQAMAFSSKELRGLTP